MTQRKIIIIGAAGRDFHNFNTFYRDNPAYKVVAFTAAQIPDIAGRKYPAALAGSLYPEPHALGTSTTRVVNSAESFFEYTDKIVASVNMRIPYEKIIFLFDKDSFKDFNDAIWTAAKKYPDSMVAWSNENFELWLRLHFNYVNTGQAREQHYDWLTDLFRKKGIFTKEQNYVKHGKNLHNIFDTIIACGGSYESAIRNAKKLLSKDISNPAAANPATMVFEAVEALLAEIPSS